MTDRDLQKLKRIELLEILVEQGKTIEQLEKELEETKKKLEERSLCIEEAGSIADASIQLTGIFDAAQEAACLYLEYVKRLSEKKTKDCTKLEAETKKRCEDMERQTQEQCQKMLEEAEAGVEEKWKEISERLEEFYDTHRGMREMLKLIGNFVKDVDTP